MTTPVSFELAKLLKEKGFEQNPMKYVNQATTEGTLVFPTIAEVVMWLYEKHGIWIEVQCPDMPTELWSFNIHRFQKYGGYGDGGGFNSPTEAYEAAIEYVLTKLIKDVQTNQ